MTIPTPHPDQDPGVLDPGILDPDVLDPSIAARLKRNEAGLVAAIAQEESTGEVLMLAWMDDTALHRTLTTGRATYFSRSRNSYWVKGEESGHRQWVRDVRLDCDGDTVLLQVHQEGPACHTGTRTCFDDGQLPSIQADPETATESAIGTSTASEVTS